VSKPYLGGKYKRYQVDVDAPDAGGKPTPVACFRYHRMCYACREHALDGLIEEVTRGEFRGHIKCSSCNKLLKGFSLWDCTAKVVIARIRHDVQPSCCPVEWSSAWLASINKHMEE
jgi:hypothetical protein